MIRGFACYNPKEQLKEFSYDAGPLKANEVEVKITHCGICHSDIHLIDNDWGSSHYPFIPGHEIIGTVAAKGDAVRGLEIGQRVGIGWQRGSCGVCEYCVKGQENLCARQTATCIRNHGGYAEAVRAEGHFVFPIPEKMNAETAAPLLCGGVTVFSPFVTHNITARHKVGVIGIGGLGHMALQFAHAFGCDVTALSSSSGKAAEAKLFGANRLIVTSDAGALRNANGSLDFILCTASGGVDVASLIPLLRPQGKICVVGALPNPITVPSFALIGNRISICGSNIGAPNEIRSMLDFAARTNVQAKVEVTAMSDVNNAIAKVRANQARYRMVLKN